MSRDISEIWRRIEAHEGEEFVLTRGQRFTYDVTHKDLLPVGRRRRLARSNFEKALQRVPLENTTSVSDVIGPSYVFAILMDPRIRRNDW